MALDPIGAFRRFMGKFAPEIDLDTPFPPVPKVSPDDEDYATALAQSSYSVASPENINFLKAALDGEEWPKGITLRKHGQQLTKDELRALGLRANTILSRECLDILTPSGREDPIHTTQAIVSALLNKRAAKQSLANGSHLFDDGSRIQVYANNTAAGPCPSCLALAEKPVPRSMAPMGPLLDCPHPDQCVLRYRSLLDFE